MNNTIPFLSLRNITAKYSNKTHEAVSRVIDSGWYLRDGENSAFEANYAEYIGVKHTVGVANGFDALFLILKAYIELGVLSPGDEVIVPANTFIASILAIYDAGLIPVLVEPSLRTYQIDDSLVEKAITKKTRALMIVHLYGRCAYSKKIASLCKRYNLKLIEDNAQAHGCRYGNRKTGSLGDAAGHSFYPGKNLGALGDAGAITTNDRQLAECARSIANYGTTKKYVSKYKGRNSRLDEIQAAILNVKLKELDADNDARKKIAREYITGIKNPAIILPETPDNTDNVFHVFPVRTKKRDSLQAFLASRGIETQIHYPIPPHKQECFKELNGLSFPVTEQIHAEELSLPISPVLKPEEVHRVIQAVNAWQGE